MAYKRKRKRRPGAGRPTKMTPGTIQKLKEAFYDDLTILQACIMADISDTAYYDFVNRYPEYAGIFKACRQNLKIRAKNTVARAIPDDPKLAIQYLKLRDKSYKQQVELSGEVKSNIKIDEYKAIADRIDQRMSELAERVIDG